MFTQYKWTDLLRMQAMKTSGFKAKLDREEASRREAREGRGGDAV